jgi:hypothetical protein
VNQDGFRADRETAEHEAAHAVIAVLTGRILYRMSIAPNEAERTEWHGSVWCTETGMPPAPWADADLSGAGTIDVSAAGFAWELLTAQKQVRSPLPENLLTQGVPWRDWNRAWAHAALDHRNQVEPFLAAADRVKLVLRRPEVAAAVEEVADALQARKTGEFPGGTAVDKIVLRHVPGLERRRHPDGRLVGGLVSAPRKQGAAGRPVGQDAEGGGLTAAGAHPKRVSLPASERQQDHVTYITIGRYRVQVGSVPHG